MEKDDALYGIFNAYSSSDDGGSSRSKRRRKDRDVDVNLTKPVKFVFTSTVILNQEMEMEKDNNNAHGLGATDTTGFGLGFTNTNSNYVGGDDDDDFLSTEFGRKIKEGARRRRNEKEKLKLLKQQKKKTIISQSWDGALGEFEKHTKGIGSKMLKNMGYKGGGLGKNEQGILTPIEPKLRPKNMGMGFNDYKETTTRDKKTSSVMSATTATAKHTRLSWKKNNANNTVKYLSAKDLTDEKRAKEEEEGVEGFLDYKVIDRRGPQVRILSNLENLNVVDQDQEMEDDDSIAPELRHNVGLTLDLVENEIIKTDRDLRNEGERGMRLMEEKARVEAEAAGQKQQLDRWEDLTNVLDRLDQESSVGRLTLISLANDMSDLQRRYADDYKLCNLSWIACSLALPLFTRIFDSWDPLRNPSHGLDVVSSWKTLLSINGGEGEGDPYTQLVFEVLVPRIAGSNTWQAKDPEPMVRFLECWEELLPPRVRDAILDTIVFPKLKNAVNLWEPCQDTVPIHLWVHPWLPVLGRKLEDLYPTIRFKLSNVLGSWHPSDPSAYAVLSPWKKVFDFASWEELMSKFIVPKLELVLQDLFQVNIHPVANQRLDRYIWVMSWAGAIPVHLMVEMMVRFFFPNWLNILKSWLVSNPNFEQVLIWYKGWKELIPEELRANESIRQHLNYGLAMMDQAAEGMEVVLPRLNAKATEAEQRQFEEEKKAAAGGRGGSIGGDEETMMSLKDVVAAHAQQHGLMFKPKPGRMHNGYQIYGFGHVSVIVDSRNQNVYAAQTEGNWSLVSLEKLLDMHKTRAIRRYPHLPHKWFLKDCDQVAEDIPIYRVELDTLCIGHFMGHVSRSDDRITLDRKILKLGRKHKLQAVYRVEYWIWDKENRVTRSPQSNFGSFPRPDAPYRKASRFYGRQPNLIDVKERLESIHLVEVNATDSFNPNSFTLMKFGSLQLIRWESMEAHPELIGYVFEHLCSDYKAFVFEVVHCAKEANLGRTYRLETIGKNHRPVRVEDYASFSDFWHAILHVMIYLISDHSNGNTRWCRDYGSQEDIICLDDDG